MMEKKEYYPIFNQQIAGLLMAMRYRLVTARPDRKDTTKNIFFFDKSEEIINVANGLRNHRKEIEMSLKDLI